jgi:glycosyltransferase involved in cell wall biosynthesis
MPQLSVITINYNNCTGLERTIKSVLAQKEVNLEYIVVDGGSNDNSQDIIAKYKDQIFYSVSEKDDGIYNAMNKGIAVANGKFLLFLNSGDYLCDDEVFLKVLPYLDDTDIVFGNLIRENTDGRKTERFSIDNVQDLLITSSLPHPATFIQKKLFTELGHYNETYKIAADYEFFARAILKHNATCKYIPVVVSVFDLSGISNDPANFYSLLLERKKIQANLFSKEQMKRAETLDIWTAGRGSRFFCYVPAFLHHVYDKFYFYWYKIKVTK